MQEFEIVVIIVLVIMILYMLYKSFKRDMNGCARRCLNYDDVRQDFAASAPRSSSVEDEQLRLYGQDGYQAVLDATMSARDRSSHKEYVKDMENKTMAAARLAVMDHDPDSSWSVRRPATVCADPSARQVQSLEDSKYLGGTALRWSTVEMTDCANKVR
jgi:hypothetical protein